METTCRLCAKEKPLNQLGRCINDRTLNVQPKLIDCCRWNTLAPIEYDAMPKRICNACYRKLETSWSFAESVAQAQQELFSRFGIDDKSALPQIEHVNIELVKDEPFESYDVFGHNEPVIESMDANAAETSTDFQQCTELTEKLELISNQSENDDNDDDASLASIDHDVFGTTAASSSADAPGGSSESQSPSPPKRSKSTKKKPIGKDIDVAKIRAESQKLPRSMSCICDTCGKELLHADGLKRHLKIHVRSVDFDGVAL